MRHVVERDAACARLITGTRIAIRIVRMPMTTKSSMSVKPFARRVWIDPAFPVMGVAKTPSPQTVYNSKHGWQLRFRLPRRLIFAKTYAMLWNEQSWPVIDALNRDTPVVIPLGSCEQHGHHLPVFVDTIQVQAVADGVEQAMGDRVLMLPAIWVGSSHHHLDYPGTISLPPELYTSVIKQIVRSVLRAGFKRLFFLNGHGGNEVPVSQALAALVA